MKLPTKIIWSDVSESKNVRRVLMGLVVLIVLIGVFKLGEIAGYHRAQFAGRYGESFNRNFNGFAGGPAGMMGGVPRELLAPGGHGAAGNIVSIALPNIVVADRDGLEKTVHISSTTDIREFRDQLTASSLTIGESVIVLGMPGDSGQIEAELIRALPIQPNTSAPSATNPIQPAQ